MPIDLRSDTVTLPSPEMRKVIAEAELGDDVYGEDPCVNKLQERVAELTGKEASLFVASGTVSNLIAQLVHCDTRHSEVIAGNLSHTVVSEIGNASQVGGIAVREAPTEADGTLDLAVVKTLIRSADIHHPFTRLLILENTHNYRGGRVLPVSYLWEARKLCDAHGIAMHCDGARIWNAAIASGQSVQTLCEPFDTVSVCLSKGLGAPIGSMLCGPKAFIEKAKHVRKMLGGGWRQAGIMASAGLYAVNEMFDRLSEDHRTAQLFASLLTTSTCLKLLHTVETNIVIFGTQKVAPEQFVSACAKRGLRLMKGPLPSSIRVVTHYGITEADICDAVDIIRDVVNELYT